jgi:hypothetical protein
MDRCQGQSILFLVIVTELLAFAHLLPGSALFDFSWAALGLVSLLHSGLCSTPPQSSATSV